MMVLSPSALIALSAAAVAPPGPAQGSTPWTSEAGAAPDSPITWYDSPRPVDRPAPAQTLIPTTAFESLNQDPEGDMPRDVAFTPDGLRVLAVNRDTDTLTVFEFDTRSIVATVTVGDFPVDVEVSPDGALAAVPNLLDDTVSFIDLATLTVAATVPVTQTTGEGQPFRVQWDDASTFCLVAVTDGAVNSRFSVIDRATLAETASFTTSPQGAAGFFGTPESGIFGNLFTDFAMDGAGTFVLLPDRGGDDLNAYAIPSGIQIANLPIGDLPAYVDISDDGTAAAVSLAGSTDAVVSLTLSTAGSPTIQTVTPTNLSAFNPQVRITPDGTEAIVAVQNAVEFIDLAVGAVVATVNTGTVGDIEFTFDDQYAVVTNFNTRIIDLGTRTQVRSLPLAATYDAAVSPVSHRLVGLNNRFAEDLHFYTTNGAAAQVQGRALSGEEPEIDAPRRLTVTPDGRTALIAGLTSRVVASYDLESRAVTAVYPVGDRVWEIATDAAGTVAVVTSTESDRVDVIDLAANQIVATLSVGTRPTAVEVSADGTRAYVTTVAGTDRVHLIDLAGAASAVTRRLSTGQLGTVAYSYGQESGIALSPDGSTLAICVSFDDELLLVDTVAESIITRVPVGDFPIRCAWAPDGSEVYVTNTFGDSVTAISFAGAASAVTATIPGQDGAFDIEVDEFGDYLYVGNFAAAASEVAVISTATMSVLTSVSLPDPPAYMELVGTSLIATAGNQLHRLRADGPSSTLIESITLAGTPADLGFSGTFGVAVTTQPGAMDGVDLTTFGGVPTNGCGPAVPNSTGASAVMESEGTYLAGGLPLTLRATGLPTFSFGYFLNSRTTGFIMNPGGSQGNVCLGGSVGRFNMSTMNSGAAGTIELEVDTLNLPNVPLFVAILPGETWSFQLWYRDANPGVTSNFTDRLTVTFE